LKRLDALLAERGLAQTRSKARHMIEEGGVIVCGKPERKPGRLCPEEAIIELLWRDENVSRAGRKLAFALRVFNITPRGRTVLDIGAGTGGFTECLLRGGAAAVYAVDVGHGQLHGSLRGDGRVTCMEGQNARDLRPGMVPRPFDLAVMDVSFISQTLIYPALAACMAEYGEIITLVKPQFEAGRGNIGKGVVRDVGVYEKVMQRLAGCAAENGLCKVGETESPITGKDGNKEFFLYMRKET
jgi:23S rRNA (cytidine1920-2'-O)/16S rRNA (cytidine1409-2'-O)-methyltransferase